METCTFEKYIMDFIIDNLSTEERKEFESHLQKCKTCTSKLNDLLEVHQSLSSYVRPEPSNKLLNYYKRNLHRLFMPESIFTTIRDMFSQVWDYLFRYPSKPVRFAKVVVILCIGILMGRLPFISSDKSTITNTNIQFIRMTDEEVKLISNFFTESEIWLLSVININGNNGGNISDLMINKEFAQELLKKTTLIDRQSSKLQNKSFVLFLHHIEFVLLEVTNANENELKHKTQEIKQMIHDNSLLLENKRLQRIIEEQIRI